MGNENASLDRPLECPTLLPPLGVAKGRFEARTLDEVLLPQVQARFEREPFTPVSAQDSRRLAIDLAEASVRLSGSTVPSEIEEVNRRFVEGEISAEEHLVLVLRLAAAFARMAGESRRPAHASVLGVPDGEAMLRAVRDVCDGRAAQPQAQSCGNLEIPQHLHQLASSVFGPEEGSRWWAEPAFGLGWERPLDVLARPGGAEIVEGLLRRIDAYVYT